MNLKSHAAALFLALANICFVLVHHPFLFLVQRIEGKWEVNKVAIWMTNLSLPIDDALWRWIHGIFTTYISITTS